MNEYNDNDDGYSDFRDVSGFESDTPWYSIGHLRTKLKKWRRDGSERLRSQQRR